jgi:ADP-heptose:LPS heptosyltransferase
VDFFRQFDHIVSFLGDSSETVNRRLAAVCRGDVAAIDPRPTESTLRLGTHITRQWAQAAQSMGLDVAEPTNNQWSLSTSLQDAWRARLAARLGVQPGRIAVCHPGSGGLAKCCPLEALEQLIAALMERRWTGAWMIGPDEIERFGSSYRDRLEKSAPVIYEESVEQAAELACGAQLYIGNDAGMTHVTAIVGVRTIALFGPTDPRVWRPLGCATDVIGFAKGNQSYAQWATEILARIGK